MSNQSSESTSQGGHDREVTDKDQRSLQYFEQEKYIRFISHFQTFILEHVVGSGGRSDLRRP